MAVKKAGGVRAKRATKKAAGTRARAGRALSSGSPGNYATRNDADDGGSSPARRKARSATKKTEAKKTRKKRSTSKSAPAKRSSTAPGAIRKSPRNSALRSSTEAPRKSALRSSVEPKVKKALSRYRQKRDFEKTAEPSGEKAATRAKALRFVIQKHAASHLHFDWRLELDGVMKSWAVPKGPSVVPGERRLAMEVEDHPISYNTFEGTIPKGQYGGGTVMLWDRGVYEATDGGGAAALRRGYAKGKLDITLLGERLKGSFTMVRTRGEGERAQWLLMKRTDDWADPDRDIVTEITTSVDSGRTMEQIAAGRRVWNSNRR